MSIELTSLEQVRAYIDKRTSFNIAADSIELVKGGYCNYTWRVRLDTPHLCHQSIILKHAQPFAAYANSEMIRYEYEALKAISESPLCGGGLIGVPAVIQYDEDCHVLIMEDIGTVPTLLDYFCTKPAPPCDLVALVATELATFIAGVHSWGKDNVTARRNLPPLQKVVGSPMLKVVIPRAALSGVIDPLLEQVIGEFTAEAETSDDTLIMGDYWLGNILIDVEEGPDGFKTLKKLWVIDWEMCRYGNPAKDVVEIAGDCFFVSRFQDAAVGECMRHHFLKTYDRVSKVNVDPFRVVVGMGVHWINWARPLGWCANEEEIRECVDRGLEYVRRGTDKSVDWNSNWARELGHRVPNVESRIRSHL
ncbi:kinase-like domain-containing protein [Hygrophoropsis aurantiaca]|uniref:Kinase-like domain-containing protein n=1 Tax=Hygrophoropsis aurantiaca TaxID=72124 RepID=A0ACB8A7N0_9AGAM|nr:kinase-like domain-containing protein [Hygrophoropsis aurantiaca]